MHRFADIKPGDVLSLDFCSVDKDSCAGPKNCATCSSCKLSKFTVVETGEFVIDGIVRIGAKIVMHETGEVKFISWTCLECAKKERSVQEYRSGITITW